MNGLVTSFVSSPRQLKSSNSDGALDTINQYNQAAHAHHITSNHSQPLAHDVHEGYYHFLLVELQLWMIQSLL
jgi:hypothetical protein